MSTIILDNSKFKIISLGFNCLPRIITTYAGFKPSKKHGELTGVFDLAVHDDLEKTISLLKNDFEDYFDGLEWDKFRDYWGNPTVSALYIHDKSLNREEFIQRYEQRILNFKESLKTPLPAFFVYSTEKKTEDEVLNRFFDTLKSFRKNPSYLIVINHGENMSSTDDDILIINENWLNLKTDPDWPYHLRVHEDPEAQRFYDSVTGKIEEFILTKLSDR